MAVGRAQLCLPAPSLLGLGAPRVSALRAAASGRTGGPSLIPKALSGSVAQFEPNVFVPWLSLRNDLIFKFRMDLHLSQGPSY